MPIAPNGRPLAGFGDRLLAYLIDLAIYLGISLIWLIPLMIWWFTATMDMMRGFTSTPLDPYEPMPDPSGFFLEFYLPMFVFVVVSVVLSLLYTYLYYVEYQLKRGGQTVGKRMMKLWVTPVHPGERLSRGHLAKRWGVQYVGGSLVPVLSYVDGFWQLWDKPLQQCLHDKAAATVVVKVG